MALASPTAGSALNSPSHSLLHRQFDIDTTAAEQSMVIDASGKVGIGTTSPGALLDLGLAGTTLGVVRLAGSTSGNVSLQPNAVAGTAVTLTLPDTTDTLVGKATTDTLTNKTFDANGTGNSISNIDVADLANGTDGELITWDATGAPATVGAGTAAQVLTSNGIGAAPTFQAAGIFNVVEDTTPQLGGNLDAQDKNITGAGRMSFTQELDNGSKTASFSVDFGTDQKQKCTLTANIITLTLDTTFDAVGNYQLKIVNGGLATLTWASETGSVYWAGGTAPTLTSSGTDMVSFYYDGTNWYGVATLDFS